MHRFEVNKSLVHEDVADVVVHEGRHFLYQRVVRLLPHMDELSHRSEVDQLEAERHDGLTPVSLDGEETCHGIATTKVVRLDNFQLHNRPDECANSIALEQNKTAKYHDITHMARNIAKEAEKLLQL